MEKITLSAKGKINLTLDVIARYPDGYHQVEMIMQSVELGDTVRLTKTEGSITLESTHPEVPVDESNLAYKAARLLKEKFNVSVGAHIEITKCIPVAGGMAGGSTNGAAALVGLNQLWDLGLSQSQLEELGFNLGADVPFCIKGGTAIARAKGEVLEPMVMNSRLWFVLVKPDFGVPTAEVYRNLDLNHLGKRPDTEQMVRALADGDLERIATAMGNVLESSTFRLYPEVAQIKDLVANAGVIKAMMSGSGPTVMGLASSHDHALSIAEDLKHRICGQIFVTCTGESGQVAG